MGYLILFIVLIAIAIYIIAVIIAAVPVWGPTLLVVHITLLLILCRKLFRLKNASVISGLLEGTIKNNKIEWTLDDIQIKSYSHPGFFYMLTGTGACWLIVAQLNNRGFFWGIEILGEKQTPQNSMTIYCIITAILVFGTLIALKPSKWMEQCVRARIQRLIRRYDCELSGLQILSDTENAINSLATSWGISFPVEYSADLHKYIEENKKELLSNFGYLNIKISRSLMDAEEDRKRFEESYRHFMHVISFHDMASKEMVLSGSILLIKQMEEITRGLHSENIKKIVEKKKWEDFHKILDMMVENIRDLNKLAQKYHAGGQDSNDEVTTGEMNEDRAYMILGLDASATPGQIKRVYRKLAEIYHPDKQIINNDNRFKMITSAYTTLKKIRGFA